MVQRQPGQRSGTSRERDNGRRTRPYSVRPAALLVVLLAGIVGVFGAGAVQSDDHALILSRQAIIEPAILANPTAQTDRIATNLPAVLPTIAPPPTQTPLPSPTVAPTTEPTPTIEPTPVSTVRPVPPPTGVEAASYIYGRGESGRKEVAFTFDAGEGPGHVSEILDLLDAHGIKGSFGVTGMWAEQNPELLKRIVSEGHMVINHTYDHRAWTGKTTGTDPLTPAERTEELARTEQIIKSITGYDTKPFFRFPYNDYDADSLVTLKAAGYDYTLFWTCDTQAWNGKLAAEIEQMCSPDDPDHGGPGAVILMHVVQDQDMAALPALVDAYEAEGYKIVTMDQMVQP